MTSLNKVKTFFNTIQLNGDDDLFVGIDVHKKSYHVAFFLNNVPAVDFVMPADKQQLIGKLQATIPALKQVVYETGPTGYGLARHLEQQSIPVSVVATSKIPKASGNNDKTDKLDSKKLSQYAAKGLLTPVKIPTLKQEADRQLFRIRHRQARNLAKVKTQIKSFLLMHDIDAPAGLKHWTKDSVKHLRTLTLQHQALRRSLDELLTDMDYFALRVKEMNNALAEHFDKGQLAKRIELLDTHPGVGTVVACQFATELFHYRDFASTRYLFKYLGLSPTIHQSGERSRGGSINKMANSRLRSNLIQAAWRWIALDVNARRTYLRILNNCGGIEQKAITAMARKLSGHLLVMLIKNQPYDPNK
jgi:transposase